MMKLWKPAYNYYYIAKKDFQSDEAWPYYASAVECAALAMFMLSSTEPGEIRQSIRFVTFTATSSSKGFNDSKSTFEEDQKIISYSLMSLFL